VVWVCGVGGLACACVCAGMSVSVCVCKKWLWRQHYYTLLYEAIQDESTELCFIFCSARSVLYFPLENIVPEILLRIRCNKPVKSIAYAHAPQEVLHAGVLSRQI